MLLSLWSEPFYRKILSGLRSFVLALGGPGLMLIALADSSFLSLPESNDILIVVLSTGNTWSSMVYYVVMTIVGSVTGCFLLFSVGRKGGKAFLHTRFGEERMEVVGRIFRRHGTLAILIPCILPPPMPFKIFVLSAGVFGVKTKSFLFAVAAGRSMRYFMWGTLAVLYGDSVYHFIRTNLKGVGIVLSGIFLASFLGYFICRLYQARRLRREATGPSAADGGAARKARNL